MTKVTIDFEKFPCFNGERRPVHVSGTALCKLTKIQENTSLGDPCRVTWIVERVESTVGEAKKRTINFGGNTSDMEDFTRWLHGRMGFKIAAELRAAHLRDAQKTEDA